MKMTLAMAAATDKMEMAMRYGRDADKFVLLFYWLLMARTIPMRTTWAWPVVRHCDNDNDNMLMARTITMTTTCTWALRGDQILN